MRNKLRTLPTFNQSHCLAGDTFAASDKAQMLGGFCLDVDAAGIDLQIDGDIGDHLWDVRGHFRLLRDDRRIDVADAPTGLRK